MSRRAKGRDVWSALAKEKRRQAKSPTLAEWTREYPEARVTRRELYTILSQIVEAPPAPEEPKEIEA